MQTDMDENAYLAAGIHNNALAATPAKTYSLLGGGQREEQGMAESRQEKPKTMLQQQMEKGQNAVESQLGLNMERATEDMKDLK